MATLLMRMDGRETRRDTPKAAGLIPDRVSLARPWSPVGKTETPIVKTSSTMSPFSLFFFFSSTRYSDEHDREERERHSTVKWP